MAVNCFGDGAAFKNRVGVDGYGAFQVGHAVAGGEGDLTVLRDADGAAGGVGVEGAEDAIDVRLL